MNLHCQAVLIAFLLGGCYRATIDKPIMLPNFFLFPGAVAQWAGKQHFKGLLGFRLKDYNRKSSQRGCLEEAWKATTMSTLREDMWDKLKVYEIVRAGLLSHEDMNSSIRLPSHSRQTWPALFKMWQIIYLHGRVKWKNIFNYSSGHGRCSSYRCCLTARRVQSVECVWTLSVWSLCSTHGLPPTVETIERCFNQSPALFIII